MEREITSSTTNRPHRASFVISPKVQRMAELIGEHIPEELNARSLREFTSKFALRVSKKELLGLFYPKLDPDAVTHVQVDFRYSDDGQIDAYVWPTKK